MKRIKLPKDVWVSLYGRLNDTFQALDVGYSDLSTSDNPTIRRQDIRDEVLNIMTFYFDRDFPQGITSETKVVIHEDS